MQRQKGSITLEGAISTIVVMAIVLSFGSFMKIVHVHSVVQHALIQTAEEISQYSYFYSLLGLSEVNDTAVQQGKEGSAAVSEGIEEVEAFLNHIGNGQMVKPNTEKLNPKKMIAALSKAFAGELYGMAKTVTINHIVTMPLLESYLPDDRDTFFEKNHVVQVGDFSGIDLGKSRYFENSDGFDEIELVAVYQMNVVSPIPIFDEVTIVQSAKSRAFFAAPEKVASTPSAEEVTESVWELSNFERADVILEQEKIPNNMPEGFQALRNFDEKNGTAVTYLTLDLNSKSYRNEKSAIRSRLKSKLHKLSDFKEDFHEGISLDVSDIRQVDYYVVIPKEVQADTMVIFQDEIERLGKYIELSDGRRVTLNIIVKQVK